MCEMRTSDKSVRPTLSLLCLLCGDIYKICQLWNRGLMQAELRDFPSVEIMRQELDEGSRKICNNLQADHVCITLSTCFRSAGAGTSMRVTP